MPAPPDCPPSALISAVGSVVVFPVVDCCSNLMSPPAPPSAAAPLLELDGTEPPFARTWPEMSRLAAALVGPG